MLGSGRESDSEGWGEEEEGKKWGEERRERKTDRETERQGNRERPADTHMHARTHAQHTQINRKRASRREGVRWGTARQWSGQNTRIYQLSLPFDMGADHGTLTQILN